MPRLLEDYIFMRWKEKSFVNLNPHEVELTIEGFYYICMNRRTGIIEGVYFDLTSQPYQLLTLRPEGSCGRSVSFASTKSS
ncbi:hypothetical protein GGI21_004032 [Coemansia aciculifera]|nr:hypothetical protein GGI21_004032 [Coemansia aciculifera]